SVAVRTLPRNVAWYNYCLPNTGQGSPMRTLFCTLALLALTSLFGSGQATPAKPPVRTPAASAASEPAAIIHTTVGDMHCQLFEKEAPIGVANFIGLANGTKDWTSPVTHAKKHGVPLYDG